MLCETLDETRPRFIVYNAQGIVHESLANYSLSLDFFQKALSIAEEMQDTAFVLHAINNMANLYKGVGNLEKAESKYLECLKLSKLSDDKYSVAFSYHNLGILCIKKEEYQRSIDFLNHALFFYEGKNYPSHKAEVLAFMADACRHMGDYYISLHFAKQSVMIFEELGAPKGTGDAYTILGKVYQALENKDSAHFFIEKAWHLHLANKNLDGLNTSSEAFYHFYKQYHQPALALKYYELHAQYRDSIEGPRTQESLIDSRIRFDLNRMRREDSIKLEQAQLEGRAALQSEESERKSLQLTAFMLLILSIAISIVLLRKKYVKSSLEKEHLLSQIQYLKLDVVPAEPNPVKPINREKLESNIDFRLNDTDWAILNALYHGPTLTNKELADKVCVSYEGVRSSLKKMYRHFQIDTSSGNQRASLVRQVIDLSESFATA